MICCNYLEMFNIQLIHVARHMHSMTIRPGRQSRHHPADHWRVAAGAGHWALAAQAGDMQAEPCVEEPAGAPCRLGGGCARARAASRVRPRASGRYVLGAPPRRLMHSALVRLRRPVACRHAAAPVREPPSPPGAPPLACSRRARRRQSARTAPSGSSTHGTACNRPPPPPLAAFPSPPFGLFRQVLSWSAARAWQTLPTCCRQRHSQRHSQRHMQRHSQRHSEMPCCKGFAAWLRHSQRHAMRHAQRHAPQHIYIIIIIIIHR